LLIFKINYNKKRNKKGETKIHIKKLGAHLQKGQERTFRIIEKKEKEKEKEKG
jgi:hypothetical protein